MPWRCLLRGDCAPPAPEIVTVERPHEQAIHDARNMREKIRLNAEIAARIAAKETEKSKKIIEAATQGLPSWEKVFGVSENSGGAT